MKNSYAIRVLTDKDLGGDQFGRPFLEAWLNGNPRLRPERFGHGERVQHPIAEKGFDHLLAEWRKPPALMFKRVALPKFVAGIEWRQVKGKDPRPYPWGIRVWLNRKAGDALAVEFFEFLIEWFEPAFAWITSNEEGLRKHFVKYPYYKNGKLIGTAEQFVGADVLDTLPGVYWLTYLTPKVIDERLLAKLGDRILCRDERGGYLIRAYERSADIGSEMARSMENEIMNVLGPERFFDIERWKPPAPETTEPASSTRH
jgi:hypothetical protein